MKYCYNCGTKLITRYLENEGNIPYCPTCHKHIFPIFSTACSMIVFNPAKDKILLIKQYNNDFYVLVAGYINKGENARECVMREVKEEVDLNVIDMTFNDTQYFEKSNTLMINFAVTVDKEDYHLTHEVDGARWFSIDEACQNIKPNSLASYFLHHYINHI